MDFIVQYPTVNQVQMVEVNAPLAEGVHQPQMDKDFYYNTILYWQTHRKYKQKIENTETLWFQMSHTGTAAEVTVKLRIYNCNGTQLNVLEAAQDTAEGITGNVYNGVILPTVRQFNFRFSDYLVTSGKYYVIMEVVWLGSPDPIKEIYYISELLHVKEAWTETALVQAKNNTNKQNIITDYTGFAPALFRQRFEGWLYKYNPASADVFFQEQDYDQRNISSTPWRTFILQVGGQKGVPAYVIDKVNAMLSMDYIMINGRRYVKNEGASWEISPLGGSEVFPLFTAEIQVREFNPQDTITTSKKPSFRVIVREDYPFMQMRADFANPSLSWVIVNKVFEDDTEFTDYVDFLNTTRNFQLGLVGTWIEEEDGIYYENGDGEDYALGTNYYTLVRKFELTAVTTAPNQTVRLEFTGGLAAIRWQGNDTGGINVHIPANSNVMYDYLHTYASAGTYTVEVFHNGGMTYIRSIGNYTGKFTTITGTTPVQLRTLWLQGFDFSALTSGLDLSFLKGNNQSTQFLEAIIIQGSQLVGLDGTIFADYPWAPGPPNDWYNLKQINFRGNPFTVSEVNSLVNDFYDNTPKFFTGIVDLRMTPVAAATGTALTKLQTLQNISGWSIQPPV